MVFLGIIPLLFACSQVNGLTVTETINQTSAIQPLSPTAPESFTQTTPPSQTPLSTNTIIATETLIPRTVIAFTGVIVPARCVQAEVDRQGNADYIYHEVRDILTGADITVGVFNATISDQVEYIGCQRSWELVGSPNNADALNNAGFDVMSVATNHIKDCGKQSCGNTAFFDTLMHFKRVGISPVGAGKNLSEALKPVVIEVHGIRFGFVSLGEVNERVFADAAKPGIAVLTTTNLMNAIERTKNLSDVVIVLPHSGPEDYPQVTPQQKYWARHAVAAGANLVVINHAHIVQGYQEIDSVPVFYSLGNFVFDQIWARDHQQGMILLVEFEGEQIVNFEFIPTLVDQDGTVHMAEGEEREEILKRVEKLSKELQQD